MGVGGPVTATKESVKGSNMPLSPPGMLKPSMESAAQSEARLHKSNKTGQQNVKGKERKVESAIQSLKAAGVGNKRWREGGKEEQVCQCISLSAKAMRQSHKIY